MQRNAHSRLSPLSRRSCRLHLRQLALLLAIVAPTTQLDAQPADQQADTAVTALSGRTMGTTYHIKYWGGGSATADAAPKSVDELLAKFDRQMSTYRDDSELARFNRAPARQWIAVSPETAYVVSEALRYQRLTEGTLDVTVGPILRLWHFGAGAEKARILKPPTDEQLQESLKLVGAKRLQVRTDPPALWKDQAGVEVDLSAIAPGYAVDLLIERLRSLGFVNAMVEIGGEVRAIGLRPNGTPWRIGVERVGGAAQDFAQVVPLKNLALSTAGDYRNSRVEGGRRYTHIIDPRTGQALPYRGAAVTVIAETCLDSDALDTALLVMGSQQGYDWCVNHEVAALFQDVTAEPPIRSTPRFDKLMAAAEGAKSAH